MNSRKINRSKYKDHSSSIYKFNIEELGGSLGGRQLTPKLFQGLWLIEGLALLGVAQ